MVIFSSISSRQRDVLVHLNVDVDVADELQRGGKRDGAEHQEEDIACEE